MIFVGLLLINGWVISGVIILAGVGLWSRYDRSNARSLSVAPEVFMFWGATIGLLIAVLF